MDKQKAAALAMDENDNLRSARGIINGVWVSVLAIWLPVLVGWLLFR